MKLLLIFWLLAGSSAFSAQGLDYSTLMAIRSFPIGFGLEGTLGYGQPIWGDPEKYLYGYIRPSATGMTSIFRNGAKVQLDVFPISFFGASINRTWSYLSINPPYYDCTTIQCAGALYTNTLSVKLMFGIVKSLVGFVSFERTLYDSTSGNQMMAEPRFGLVLAPSGEGASSYTMFLGYQLDSDWVVGGLGQFTSLSLNTGTQDSEYLAVRRTYNEWNFNAGVGRFQSSVYGTGYGAMLAVIWNGKKKIGF